MGAVSKRDTTDDRSEQAKKAIIDAARAILEERGSIDAVTLTNVAERAHYATSVVHYHTGGIEPLKDELFQQLSIEYIFTLFLGESSPGRDQAGHEVILAGGRWVKDNPAAARFLAQRVPNEVREPVISGAKGVFGIDLEADPDGLSITRFMQRTLLSPVELILDAEDGAKSIDDESVVALGLLSWRHLRAGLSILASRPMGQGALAPLSWPKPGIMAPVPVRSDAVEPLTGDALVEARHQLLVGDADAVPSELHGPLHAALVGEVWPPVLGRGEIDDDAIHQLMLWLSSNPASARFLFFSPGRSGVPVDAESLGLLVPGLQADDHHLETVSMVLSRTISSAAELVSFAPDDNHAVEVLRSALDGARSTLRTMGWVR
jgi:AcrR family transcriptional regulator